MGADPEHDFQIVQVTRGLNRGARVGLDRGPIMGLVWWARSGCSTCGLVWGLHRGSVDEERHARCLANVREAQASYICALVYSVARMSETLYCFSRLAVVGCVHRFPSFSEEFGLTQPFKGLNINGSLHMTI